MLARRWLWMMVRRSVMESLRALLGFLGMASSGTSSRISWSNGSGEGVREVISTAAAAAGTEEEDSCAIALAREGQGWVGG